MTEPLMSLAEAAAHLSKGRTKPLSPDAARKFLNRYGITEKRGYDRAAVLALKPAGQGRRTDLQQALDTADHIEATYQAPTRGEKAAVELAAELRRLDKDQP